MNSQLDNLGNAPIVEKLPALYGSRDNVPSDMKGATIFAIGTLDDRSLVEGGGLVIDYRPAGTTETRRVVFAFDEVAMWVESQSNAVSK